MTISDEHIRLAKVLIENQHPEEAIQVLAFGMIPLEDSEELKAILAAKLLHIPNQKPYVKFGKPLFKALDDIAPFLSEAHKNIRKPIFTITDREALTKALNKSSMWTRFDVKGSLAYVTKKEAKESIVGRQDLVLAIVFSKNPSKPYAKVFLCHLSGLDGKVLTFGYNFFRELPEQNELEGRSFSWKITLEEATVYQGIAYANYSCDMVADHAANDFKGNAEELAAEMLKRIKAEGKALFTDNYDTTFKVGRNKDKNWELFLASLYHASVSFITGDWSRLHVRDARVLKAVGDNMIYDISMEVL